MPKGKLNITEDGKLSFMVDEDGKPIGPENLDAAAFGFDMVHIETEFLTTEALPFHVLPGEQILEMMIAPEPYKMAKMYELFKLALDADAVSRLGLLSFKELNEAVSQWMNGSGPMDGVDSEEGMG